MPNSRAETPLSVLPELLTPDNPFSISSMNRMAGALASERELVVTRLRRMGVDILRADFDSLGPALLSRYAEIKQRDRL